MQQNHTFEGGRGPDGPGAEERVNKIHVIEPGCRENLTLSVFVCLQSRALRISAILVITEKLCEAKMHESAPSKDPMTIKCMNVLIHLFLDNTKNETFSANIFSFHFISRKQYFTHF